MKVKHRVEGSLAFPEEGEQWVEGTPLAGTLEEGGQQVGGTVVEGAHLVVGPAGLVEQVAWFARQM